MDEGQCNCSPIFEFAFLAYTPICQIRTFWNGNLKISKEKIDWVSYPLNNPLESGRFSTAR